jgi:hypothetical protein
MPSRTSADEVQDTVRTFVAAFAQMKVSDVGLMMVLKKAPLRFDDNKLVLLASSLRGYVKSFNPDGTVKSADTKKDGLTVQTLGELVFKRITGTTA